MPDISDELESLRRQNARLRKLLKLTEAEASPARETQTAWFDETPGPVNAHSSSQAKVEFYAALSAARRDVYAASLESWRNSLGLVVDESRLAAVCADYGIGSLLVFGSVARGDAAPDSDVDVLHELLPGRRLGREIEDLADELADIRGRPVDLVSASALIRGCGRRCWARRAACMRREVLLLEEMIDAADEAHRLVGGSISTTHGEPPAPRRSVVELHRSRRGVGPADVGVQGTIPARALAAARSAA